MQTQVTVFSFISKVNVGYIGIGLSIYLDKNIKLRNSSLGGCEFFLDVHKRFAGDIQCHIITLFSSN